MRIIPIRWTELETAFERNASDTESYVDARTGEVVTIIEGQPETGDLRQRIMSASEAYIKIEPASSREQYSWMLQFVATVTDEVLREHLMVAIDGKGAFRRFKDVLHNYPADRERWFSYRGELLHWSIHQWLEREQIEPASPPPWPVVKPRELEVVAERPPTTSEGPGELLRRQAKELIDQLPAVLLQAVIPYLEYLRDRGIRSTKKTP